MSLNYDIINKELDKLGVKLHYGTITLQIRDGKITLIKVEQTVRLDDNKLK
ncbi:MAG: hypothetical protein WDA59_04020 [Methanofastidiosum sp.]